MEIALKYDEKGLICAIVQDVYTGEVLMQAYMNEEALNMTLSTGYAHYYSRSRKCLWKKGETSGHIQKVFKILYDCDGDALVLLVEQKGAACHTGNKTCFYRTFKEFEFKPDYKIIFDDAKTIHERHLNPIDGSYTNYLLNSGIGKICKKVGEEATECVVAAVSNKKDELIGEIADLLYHTQVLMEACDINMQDVFEEMMNRKGLTPKDKYKNPDSIVSNTDKIKENK